MSIKLDRSPSWCFGTSFAQGSNETGQGHPAFEMLYSRSTQYAIRAITFLSLQQEGRYYALDSIADKENIPKHFLAKLMQRLVKRGLVKSVKGVHGGFSLAFRPEQINLFMIADTMDDLSSSFHECIFGGAYCSESRSCPLHASWLSVRNAQLDFLRNTTIADASMNRHRVEESPIQKEV